MKTTFADGWSTQDPPGTTYIMYIQRMIPHRKEIRRNSIPPHNEEAPMQMKSTCKQEIIQCMQETCLPLGRDKYIK